MEKRKNFRTLSNEQLATAVVKLKRIVKEQIDPEMEEIFNSIEDEVYLELANRIGIDKAIELTEEIKNEIE